MDRDHQCPTGQVPPPAVERSSPPGRTTPARPPAPVRQSSIRRLRQLSNWTAAALIVGTGSATWALAHHFPAPAAAGTATSWTPTGTAGPAQGTGPRVSGAVAVSSGSGAVAGAGSAAAAPAGAPVSAAPGSAPQVSGPVAVSSGSGVSLTTTRVVNGTTVTTVQHIANGDD